MLTSDRSPPQPSRLEAIVESVADKVGEELRSERWGPRLRVTAVFSLLTLAMLAILIRVILAPTGGDGQQAPQPLAASESERSSGAEDANAGAPGSQALAENGTGSAGAPLILSGGAAAGAAPAVQAAKWRRPPSFAGERHPPGSLRQLEQAAGLPALIESVGRRAIIAGPSLSPAVEREWAACLDEAGRTWPLMDRRHRDTIVAACIETLRGVDQPAVVDRLVAPLRGGEPVTNTASLWSNAFRSGVLAEILARASLLPPGLVASAGEALRAGVAADAGAGGLIDGGAADRAGSAPRGDQGGHSGSATNDGDGPRTTAPADDDRGQIDGGGAGGGFPRGAAARLDASLPKLVDELVRAQREARDAGSTVEAGSVAAPAPGEWANLWEGWITAQRAVRSGTALQGAYAAATSAILRSGMDLSITGPGSDVLGRLVTPLLDFNDDPGVRRSLLAWLDDPRISSDALWVLTSLMLRNAGIAWFRSDLLIDWSSSLEARRAIRDAIALRWAEPAVAPPTTRPAIVVTKELLEQWRRALRGIEGRVAAARAPSELLRALLLCASLNEAAAAIEVGQEPRARDLVAEVGPALDPAADPNAWPPGGGVVAGAVGSPSGPDGEWARQLEGAERNLEQRLATIRHLRTRPGGDLGPRDAELFIREVIRGSPLEVRSVARSVLLESFRQGPNVLLELLDQLAEANPTEELSQVIGELLERPLPSVRSPEWVRESRVALLRHLIELRRGTDAELDLLATAVAEVMRSRLTLLPRTSIEPPRGDAPPQTVLARLVDGWRERAGGLLVVRPIPAPLAELDRRRSLRQQVAFGAIVLFVAEQAAHLELLAFVLSAEAPWLAPPIQALVQQAAIERGEATSALAQSLLGELAIARLWELAFAGPEESTPASAASTMEPSDGRAEEGSAPLPAGSPPNDRPSAPGTPDRGDAPVRPREAPQMPPPGVEPPTRMLPPVRR